MHEAPQPAAPDSRTLAGRVAVVTGASRGLGRAIAEALWREGASLLLVARGEAALRELAQALTAARSDDTQRAHVCVADLADPAAPAHIAAAALARFGAVDVLVNDAALVGPIGLLWQTDARSWDTTIRVNLVAPVDLCRRLVPGMIARGCGRIVNVSGGGATTPLPRFSAYGTAKAGLARFTETLALELAGTGVEVNGLSPGPLDTAMHAEIRAAGEAAGEAMSRLAREVLSSGDAPLARAAALAVFLASPASRGISGRLVSAVWDPWHSLADRVDELARTDVYTLRRITPGDRGLDWGEP